jgi:3-phenylpropionate/trans-cinnamate dioxygenase ferredoxin subunit
MCSSIGDVVSRSERFNLNAKPFIVNDCTPAAVVVPFGHRHESPGNRALVGVPLAARTGARLASLLIGGMHAEHVTSFLADHLMNMHRRVSVGRAHTGRRGARDDLKEHSMMTRRSVTVARTADIKPGELAAFDVAGVRIAVANTNGRFFAIDDTCTHEQCSLTEEGTLEGTVVTCECHGAQFDVTTGQVLAPPAFEPVTAYRLRVEQDAVVIEI